MTKSSAQEPGSAKTVTYIGDLPGVRKEKPCDITSQNSTQISKKHEDETGSLCEVADMSNDESDPSKKNAVKKRKKYQAMDESYRLNRTMRDKDFKLARSNFYSFKDTLGKSAPLCCGNLYTKTDHHYWNSHIIGLYMYLDDWLVDECSDVETDIPTRLLRNILVL